MRKAQQQSLLLSQGQRRRREAGRLRLPRRRRIMRMLQRNA
jgi:hypothetical protein